MTDEYISRSELIEENDRLRDNIKICLFLLVVMAVAYVIVVLTAYDIKSSVSKCSVTFNMPTPEEARRICINSGYQSGWISSNACPNGIQCHKDNLDGSENFDCIKAIL